MLEREGADPLSKEVPTSIHASTLRYACRFQSLEPFSFSTDSIYPLGNRTRLIGTIRFSILEKAKLIAPVIFLNENCIVRESINLTITIIKRKFELEWSQC